MPLPYTIDTHRPTQIGLIVLQSDETIERDFRLLFPPEVEFLVTRVASGASVSLENLRAMEHGLTASARLFPVGARFSAVGYACTSASAAIGATRVAEVIAAGVATPHVTDPLTALVAACAKLNLSRIGVLSPYVASVSDRLIQALQEAGITVSSFASFDEPLEERVVRISPTSLRDAAIAVGRGADCDAVFLSCTNLRVLESLDAIEAALGKPVLSSNQVLAWHLACLAGVAGRITPVGRLLRNE